MFSGGFAASASRAEFWFWFFRSADLHQQPGRARLTAAHINTSVSPAGFLSQPHRCQLPERREGGAALGNGPREHRTLSGNSQNPPHRVLLLILWYLKVLSVLVMMSATTSHTETNRVHPSEERCHVEFPAAETEMLFYSSLCLHDVISEPAVPTHFSSRVPEESLQQDLSVTHESVGWMFHNHSV